MTSKKINSIYRIYNKKEDYFVSSNSRSIWSDIHYANITLKRKIEREILCLESKWREENSYNQNIKFSSSKKEKLENLLKKKYEIIKYNLVREN